MNSSPSPHLTRDVVFYGPPGSGKTTQATRIAAHFHAHLFSIGTVLRQIAQEPTTFGKQVADIIRAGDFLDDPTHLRIYREGAQSANPNQAIIFEGVGRLPRLKTILDQVESERDQKYIIINLQVDPKIATERISKQTNRTDKTLKTIANRLSIFQTETLPVIESHQKERPVLDIDDNLSTDEVTTRIISALAPFTS